MNDDDFLLVEERPTKESLIRIIGGNGNDLLKKVIRAGGKKLTRFTTRIKRFQPAETRLHIRIRSLLNNAYEYKSLNDKKGFGV
jgi:hypothetical protein